jgi:murein L,D-transpeptidase YcbB/YkuD
MVRSCAFGQRSVPFAAFPYEMPTCFRAIHLPSAKPKTNEGSDRVLRRLVLTVAMGALLTAPAVARIEQIQVPASRQQGLDMIIVDEETMPQEPERARRLADVEQETLSGAPLDQLAPVHHLYADLRRQLEIYRQTWSKLPQLRVGSTGPALSLGSADPRVPALRQRLGLPRQGGFDSALRSKLVEYQNAHGLSADGKVGPGTIASLNRGAAYYERLIFLNMERARRLPAAGTRGKYLLVDAGSARLWMYEDGRPVDSMKVVVGAAQSATPMMAALMRFSSVNPYWNVPLDLAKTLIAPRVVSQGVSYLTDRRYQVLDGWTEDAPVLDPATIDWRAVASGDLEVRVRQLPGGGNSMGDIKFMMPNEYGIYLHDTPNKALFNEDNRWVSNGCVRVEDARRLARWLHGGVPRGTSPDAEERVDLGEPVPVYITYFTVGADAKQLTFRKDPYARDAAVLARLPTLDNRMIDPDEQFRKAMMLDS